jgi:hypothetical protein
MKRFTLLAGLVLALTMTGCMSLSVPKTVISGNIAGQPFSITSPKDSELAGLAITVTTNGAVSIRIETLKATMNPAIISMTGDAQAKIISAVASGVAGALGTAGGAAAGSAIK